MNCELVGVADINYEKARAIGETYKVEYYRDYRSLLNRVEAVSIAVPTTLHHATAIDFLNEGVHCMVEKPIAISLEEARDMIRAASENKVNLAVGHIERFNPAVKKLKQVLEKGILGKILMLSARRVGPYVPRIRDVGVVIDSATHDIGVIRYLVGKDPISIFSRAGSLKHVKEDHAIIILDFEDITASIEVNWFTPHKVRTLVVTGSEGIAYLDYIEQKLVIHNSTEIEDEEIKREEPLRLELEDFLTSAAEGSKPSVDGYEGLNILKIALESCSDNYCASLSVK
jgi:UDP-N-acetylglucosamine 3-dehydrogenase